VDSKSPYGYLRSKGEGEDAVRASGLDWMIVRPSVLVGPEDEFANALARWLVITPLAFPLVGNGQARFQPLWVGDLTKIFGKLLQDPRTVGQAYELGGPEVLTYEEMVKQILSALQRKRALLHVNAPHRQDDGGSFAQAPGDDEFAGAVECGQYRDTGFCRTKLWIQAAPLWRCDYVPQPPCVRQGAGRRVCASGIGGAGASGLKSVAKGE
jgi:uncharacterized protein YbjT (DUF2867 family)